MKPVSRDQPALVASNELWQQALEELRMQMTEATYQSWLAGSYAIDSAAFPAGLTIALRNNYAKEWLTHRLQAVVNQTVSAIAGRAVVVDFFVESHNPEDSPVMGRENLIENRSAEQAADKPLGESGPRPSGGSDPLPSGVGSVPASAAAPPPDIPLDNRLTRGDPDSMTAQHNPMRVRIYSHITQSSFLHVEDALSIGKLRLFAGSYRRGKGITTNAHHFLDTADARVVLLALIKAEPGFAYQECKGSANNGPDAISRVLSIKARGDRVYIELKNGPGHLTGTGAIQPNGRPTAEVTIPFKTYEAQRLAVETLAYLQAWDVMRLAAHRDLISGLPPYPLAPPPDSSPAGRVTGLSDSQADDME